MKTLFAMLAAAMLSVSAMAMTSSVSQTVTVHVNNIVEIHASSAPVAPLNYTDGSSNPSATSSIYWLSNINFSLSVSVSDGQPDQTYFHVTVDGGQGTTGPGTAEFAKLGGVLNQSSAVLFSNVPVCAAWGVMRPVTYSLNGASGLPAVKGNYPVVVTFTATCAD